MSATDRPVVYNKISCAAFEGEYLNALHIAEFRSAFACLQAFLTFINIPNIKIDSGSIG